MKSKKVYICTPAHGQQRLVSIVFHGFGVTVSYLIDTAGYEQEATYEVREFCVPSLADVQSKIVGGES